MIYVFKYLSCLFVSFSYLYSLKKIGIFSPKNKHLSTFLFMIIQSVALIYIFYESYSDFKIFLLLFSLFFNNIIIFKHSHKESFVFLLFIVFFSVIYEILICFSTIFFSLIFDVKLVCITQLSSFSFTASLLINVFYGIYLIFIFNLQFVIRLFKKIFDYVLSGKVIFFMISSFLLLFYSYELLVKYNVSIDVSIIFIGVLVLVIYISICSVNSIINFCEMRQKYDNSLSDLSKYEDMIDKYRIDNHENKNQLQMIRAMINHNDDNVVEYINNLVDTVYMENEKLLMDLSILQSGIRATIYTKLLNMSNKGIKYNFSIDKSIRDIDELNNKLSLKVCNVISVFLDNAIDEVFKKDDTLIDIKVFLDNKCLVFEISNNVSSINLENIYDKGYTTKEKGHGYGLSYAKDIIDKDPLLSNDFYVNENIFTQKLIVKV